MRMPRRDRALLSCDVAPSLPGCRFPCQARDRRAAGAAARRPKRQSRALEERIVRPPSKIALVHRNANFDRGRASVCPQSHSAHCFPTCADDPGSESGYSTMLIVLRVARQRTKRLNRQASPSPRALRARPPLRSQRRHRRAFGLAIAESPRAGFRCWCRVTSAQSSGGSASVGHGCVGSSQRGDR